MKVRPSVKPICEYCKVIRRNGRVMVICPVVISLTYVYGIGLATSQKILAAAGVSEDIRVRDLTSDQEDAIRREVDAIKVEGDLRREVNLNIKRLMEIGSYRGIRHRRGLPVRGQRKGKAVAIAGKKK